MARESDQHSGDLVEPEGVNAASDRIGAPHNEGDVVGGGRPDQAPDPDQQPTDGAADLVAAPTDDEGEPSQPQGPSGQDSGLME